MATPYRPSTGSVRPTGPLLPFLRLGLRGGLLLGHQVVVFLLLLGRQARVRGHPFLDPSAPAAGHPDEEEGDDGNSMHDSSSSIKTDVDPRPAIRLRPG